MITGKYKEFYLKLNTIIPKERLLHDSLSTLAFGTDASFYRLIPKLAEELEGALLFLLNNEAASFITGVVLPIDGGFSAYSGV